MKRLDKLSTFLLLSVPLVMFGIAGHQDHSSRYAVVGTASAQTADPISKPVAPPLAPARRHFAAEPVKAVLRTPDKTVAPGEAMFFDASNSVIQETSVVNWDWPEGSFRVIDKTDLSAMAKAPKEPGLFTVTLSIHDLIKTGGTDGEPIVVTPTGSATSVTIEIVAEPTTPVVAPPTTTPTTPTTTPTTTPVDTDKKVTSVTYVHEKDDDAVPDGVKIGLDKLNQRGIVATSVDQDQVDGDGDIPEQYKLAIPAAKQAGLPALVVQAGSKVVNVVKKPETEQQVLEVAP